MKHFNVLEKAILSEKAYQLMGRGIYTFFVKKQAKKDEIKAFVEKTFSVNVTRVNVTSVPSKQKRIAKTKKTINVGGGKKAIVYLKAGQIIAALSPKQENKTKSTKTMKEKDIQKVLPEGKEG